MECFAGFVVKSKSSMDLSSKKRVHLSLETKVKLINEAKSDSHVTVRSLADKFSCGKLRSLTY